MSESTRINDTLFEKDQLKVVSRRCDGEDAHYDEAYKNRHIFMRKAFALAEDALNDLEVPIGCVFVYKGEVIGEGRNDVNQTRNASRHAEMIGAKNIMEWCKEQKLNPTDVFRESTLYVTLEPCMMCASALQQLGVPRIFFGACNDRFGGVITVGNIFHYEVDPPKMDIVSGLGAAYAIKLLQDFYQNTNMRAPADKRIIKQPKKAVDPE